MASPPLRPVDVSFSPGMWVTGETRISESDDGLDRPRHAYFRGWYLAKCSDLLAAIDEKRIPYARLLVLKDWAHNQWLMQRDLPPPANHQLFLVDLINSASYLQLLVRNEPHYRDISDEKSFERVPPSEPDFTVRYFIRDECGPPGPM